jgi:hypothetical protein
MPNIATFLGQLVFIRGIERQENNGQGVWRQIFNPTESRDVIAGTHRTRTEKVLGDALSIFSNNIFVDNCQAN